MNTLNHLQLQYEGRWTGFKIVEKDDDSNDYHVIREKLPLCQALAQSFEIDHPVLVPAESIGCEGALRSLGLKVDDEALARGISKKTEIAYLAALQNIQQVCCFEKPVAAVLLGHFPCPDMYIGLVKPDAAMRLIRQCQAYISQKKTQNLNTFLSICGGIIATVYSNKELSLSMGCPSSRESGVVQQTDVVIGFPYSYKKICL